MKVLTVTALLFLAICGSTNCGDIQPASLLIYQEQANSLALKELNDRELDILRKLAPRLTKKQIRQLVQLDLELENKRLP